MDEQIKSSKSDKEKKHRKVFLLISLLFLVAMMSIGLVISFFSDVIEQSNDFTTGTLKISGDYTFFINGTETLSPNITNLNPGDIIVIKANITNNGNKSAWIRNAITFTTSNAALLPYLKIYYGEFTKDELPMISEEDYLLPLNGDTAVTENYVINGSGIDAETENGGGYNYLKSTKYSFAITIYFNSSATNEVQGKAFNLLIETQALQFRNNNTLEPDNSAWATVSAA